MIISFQLCLSGWIGVLLTTCCRYHYPGTKQDGCVFPVKAYHIVSTSGPRCAVRSGSVPFKGLSSNKTIELMQSQVSWMRSANTIQQIVICHPQRNAFTGKGNALSSLPPIAPWLICRTVVKLERSAGQGAGGASGSTERGCVSVAMF